VIYALGVEYLGLNSLFTSVLQVLNLAELGVGSAMVYSMYKPIAEDDSQMICALMRLYKLYYRVIGLVVAGIGLLLLPFLPKLISDEVPPDINIYVLYMMYLVSTALSYSVFSYRCCLLEAYQSNYVMNRINLVTMIVQFVLQTVFLVLFKNYYIYILTQFSVQIVNQIAVYLCVRKNYPDIKPEGKIDKQMTKQIILKVKGLFYGKIGGIILKSSDTIVISMYLGLTTLAIYQNYFFVITAIVGFVSSIMAGSRAAIGNSLVTETADKNYRDFRRFSFIMSWIVCVCTNCFLVLFQPFMKLWMGEDRMLPMSMVVLFCLYFFLYEYNLMFNTFKDAAGLWYEDRFRALLTSLVNLILNLLFVRYIGLYGIIASTVLSILLVGMPWLLHNLFTLLFRRSVSGYLGELAKYTAVTVLSCFVSYFITGRIDLDGVPALVVNAVVAVSVPCSMYLVFFRKNEHFHSTLALAKRLLGISK
jgi:O-antigen/teichoic acid export membrane protein